ncbi:hypothetical protein niasHT_023160 [Heterodera trifolii]|uniref:Superoxide dismutase copper/zinc binding domain-containing protein n=1 Tax=Heterodera trifolii TaxID=157864 RepID=A0ABD2JE10_9BILA
MGRKPLPAELLNEIVHCVRREHAHANICFASFALQNFMLPRVALWRRIWLFDLFKLRPAYRKAERDWMWRHIEKWAGKDEECHRVIRALDSVMQVPQAAVQRKAICRLLGRPGHEKVKGTVTFYQNEGDENVLVRGTIKGLPPGEHAFTIYESGDLSSKTFHSVGRHFQHESQRHGAPHNSFRHVGDLGNILADANGTAEINWSDKIISLYGPNNIIGRSLVVHEREDDFGEGCNDVGRSRESGNAGAKLSCGVIGITFDTNKSTLAADYGSLKRSIHLMCGVIFVALDTYKPTVSAGFGHAFMELRELYGDAASSEMWHFVVKRCAIGGKACALLIESVENIMKRPRESLPLHGISMPKKAVCTLVGVGTYNVKGTVTFTQNRRDDRVMISGDISLPSGKHGLHIHEFGNISDGCLGIGGHFNPMGEKHGGPKDWERHVGDLGNIDCWSSFSTRVELSDRFVSLFDDVTNVIGRALVVHQFQDDLGRGVGDKAAESKRTGNAGDAIAWGVIGLADGWTRLTRHWTGIFS